MGERESRTVPPLDTMPRHNTPPTGKTSGHPLSKFEPPTQRSETDVQNLNALPNVRKAVSKTGMTLRTFGCPLSKFKRPSQPSEGDFHNWNDRPNVPAVTSKTGTTLRTSSPCLPFITRPPHTGTRCLDFGMGGTNALLPLPPRGAGERAGERGNLRRSRISRAPPLPSPLLHPMEERESVA